MNDIKSDVKETTIMIQSSIEEFIHPSRVLTSYIHRVAYANDASYFRLVPQAVVQPDSMSEIQALFKFTQQNKIPMTFRQLLSI
jgi:D-lactate dehydrogenase